MWPVPSQHYQFLLRSASSQHVRPEGPAVWAPSSVFRSDSWNQTVVFVDRLVIMKLELSHTEATGTEPASHMQLWSLCSYVLQMRPAYKV